MIKMKYFVYVLLLSAWATHCWASDDETLDDTRHIIRTQNQSYSESLYIDSVVNTPEYETCLDLLRTINADKARIEKYGGENPNLIANITENQRVLGETLQQLMEVYNNYRTECNNQNVPVLSLLYDNPELQIIISDMPVVAALHNEPNLQTLTPENIICSIVPVADDRTDSPIVKVLSIHDLLDMISQYLDEEDYLALDLVSHQIHFNVRKFIANHMTRFARSVDPASFSLHQDILFNRVPSTPYFQDILNDALSVVLYTNPYVQFHKKLPASLTAKHLPELRNIELDNLDKILACLLPYTIYATSDNKDITEPHPKLKKDLDALKEGRTYTFFSALTENPEEVEVEGTHYIIMTETEFRSEQNRNLLTPHFVHNPAAYLLLDLETETPARLSFHYFRTIYNILLINTQNNITETGEWFLWGADSCFLTMDLSPLSTNLTKIGTGFFWQWDRSTVDLSPLSKLSKLREIGDSFLSVSTLLQDIDLSPLSNLTKIGSYFLSGCTGLQTVDLSQLYNLTEVGNFCFAGCYGLRTITVANEEQMELFRSKIPGYILDQIEWIILDNECTDNLK
jgi:hypothetical protein